MSTSTTPLPVYLLTGFLGSGKTTLLSQLIRQPVFADTAVIVNEFGDVGLDHVLLEKADDRDVVLLESGCLCCASNAPLQDTLDDLYYRRLRGATPMFSRVVVETSGLANPLPLMNAINAAPDAAHRYYLAGVVTVFDAVLGLASLDTFHECAVQLSVADRVVLSKTDIATQEQQAAARHAIARLNPDASLLDGTPENSVDLLDGLTSAHASTTPATPVTPEQPGNSQFAHLLRYGIQSHVLRADHDIGWPQYAAFVAACQQRLGEHLLRTKGILTFAEDGPHAVHGVRHLFAPPRLLAHAIPARQCGALVLITRDADGDDIAAIATTLNATISAPYLSHPITADL